MIAVVLPILPSHFSSTILNGLRYLQIFGTLLDDLAAVLVGVGFMVVLSGLVVG
jgi:GET complex subunit GET2